MLTFFLSLSGIYAQVEPPATSAKIMFYNVENLFDIVNDSSIHDEEFLSEGNKNWNNYRLNKKINGIYKVIAGLGEWNLPAIIGLAEIENREVLEMLLNFTPLKQRDYQIIHFDSPDERGIDVALLYRNSLFQLVNKENLKVKFPDDPEDRTRDILYVKGLLFQDRLIHVFVNHWPSRSGGVIASQAKRNYVANLLSVKIDSILKTECRSDVLIMGDFNDNPGDESIMDNLIYKSTDNDCSNHLVNLMDTSLNYSGTLKYKEQWFIFDQIIVTKTMLDGINDLMVKDKEAYIYNPDFLLEEDEKYLGWKPFRTYAGPRYLGGYSDHFPVYIEILNLKN